MGRLERFVPGIVTWGCYVLAGLATLRHLESSSLPASWRGQALVLLVICAILAALVPWVRRRFGAGVLISAQWLLGLVLAYPLHPSVEVAAFFFVAVSIQAIFVLGRGWMLALVLLELQVLFSFLPRVPVWERSVPSLPWDVLVYLEAFGLGLIYLFQVVRDHRVVVAAHHTQRVELQKAVLDVLQLNREHQEFALQLRERSGAEERRRLSRDIHDILGYTLVNLQVVFEMALDQAQAGQTRLLELLHQGLDQCKDGLARSRVALRDIRTPQDASYDWKQHVRRLGKNFAEITNVRVVENLDQARATYSEATRTFILHFVQETMANAYRHGQASRIEITCWEVDRVLHLSARDNGKGTQLIVEGIGFRGIQERVEVLGGRFSFIPLVGGFQIDAELPVEPERSA